MPVAAIALGSNLASDFGHRAQNLEQAIVRLATIGTVNARSTFFDTEPVGFVEQPRFLNAAVLLETVFPPLELLSAMLAIERAMGRRRDGVPPKGPRIIDLDLLYYNQVVLSSPALTLPHPAIADRVFVLAPLAEIAPAWLDPHSGLTVAEMLARVHLT